MNDPSLLKREGMSHDHCMTITRCLSLIDSRTPSPLSPNHTHFVLSKRKRSISQSSSNQSNQLSSDKRRTPSPTIIRPIKLAKEEEDDDDDEVPVTVQRIKLPPEDKKYNERNRRGRGRGGEGHEV